MSTPYDYLKRKELTVACLEMKPRLNQLGEKQPRYRIVYHWGEWRDTALLNHGMSKAKILFIRSATAEELEEDARFHRARFYDYDDWEELRADEAKYGIDADLLAKKGG